MKVCVKSQTCAPTIQKLYSSSVMLVVVSIQLPQKRREGLISNNAGTTLMMTTRTPEKCLACFDALPRKVAVRLLCNHCFCRPCAARYVAVTLKGLPMQAEVETNPFSCPICGFDMTRTMVMDLIGNRDNLKQRYLAWEKEQNYPRAHMLRVCPSVELATYDTQG